MSGIKHMFLFGRGRKAYTNFLISYLIILLITTIIGYFAYINSVNVIKEEVQNYNLALIKQAKEIVDTRMVELWQLSYQVSRNEKINRLMIANNQLSVDDRLDIIQLFIDLQVYKSLNNFFDYFYIYLENPDIILDINSKYDPGFFYKEIAGYEDIDYNTWYKDIINSSEFRKFIPSSPMKMETYNKYNMVTYVQAIPYNNNALKAKIVFLINEAQFLSFFNKKISGLEQFYIADSQGNIITHIGNIGNITNIAINKDGFIESTLNNKKIVVASIKSEIVDWTYNIIIPYEVFYQKVEKFRDFYLVIEFITIAIGALIAGLLSYKDYIPIREIIESIRTQKGDDGSINAKTEYEYIKSSMLSTFNEANSLKFMLENYKDLFRTNLLLRLIKGEIPVNESRLVTSDSLGINLDYKAFAVMILQIGKSCVTSSELGSDFNNLINKKLKDIPEKPDSFYFIEIETGKYIAVLCFAIENEMEITKRINSFSNVIEHYYSNRFGIKIKNVVGKIVYNVKEIPHSFSDVERELKNKDILNDDVTSSENESTLYEQLYYYPMSTEMQLYNKAVSGNINDVVTLIEEVYEMNFTSLDLSFQMVQYLFFAIMNTAINVIYDIEMDIEYNPLIKLASYNKIEEICNFTRDVFRDICKWVVIKKTDHHNTINNKILEFIENNYSDMNLSLSIISEKYNLSPSSICRIIKEQTGEGFVDYLNKCRLNKAKYFLENTEFFVNNIAEKIGYQSDNTFIRIFKKYNGITPRQYREAQMIKLDTVRNI